MQARIATGMMARLKAARETNTQVSVMRILRNKIDYRRAATLSYIHKRHSRRRTGREVGVWVHQKVHPPP
jgi:hypothetical protein